LRETASFLCCRYRKLALQHHPEKNPGDLVAAENFLQIAEAYDVLSDGMSVLILVFRPHHIHYMNAADCYSSSDMNYLCFCLCDGQDHEPCKNRWERERSSLVWAQTTMHHTIIVPLLYLHYIANDYNISYKTCQTVTKNSDIRI